MTGPGTAITTRPSSAAQDAVFRAPDRAPASTTTVPALRAAINRLRPRKLARSGRVPGASSVTTAPLAWIWFRSPLWLAG